jgi:hypothetical protein
MKDEPKAVKAKLAHLLSLRMLPFPRAGERLNVLDVHGVYIIMTQRGA